MGTNFNRRGNFRDKDRNRERVIMNDRIRADEVRLIGEDGSQLGVKSLSSALDLAKDQGLDLLLVSPDAKPPVCRIIDYGKFCYQKEKQKKVAKKKQKVVHQKEIKMRPRIGEHDLDVKVKHVIKFLQDSDKVKITITFFGRERQYVNLGKVIMQKIIEKVAEFGVPESDSKYTGNMLTMILVPKN